VPDDWIRQWGDPVLREVAAPVRSFDDVLRGQVARMKRRLADAEGLSTARARAHVGAPDQR
jgi:peptide deformylase